VSDIQLQALGRGKIKVGLDLIYPHIDGQGNLTANIGQSEGTGNITGDEAVYSIKDFGSCSITIKFVRPGLIEVTQNGTDTDCGFGKNVTAAGTYKKVSSRRPKFGVVVQ